MKKPGTSAAVIIPVYQYPLSANEALSLRQCIAVLGHYPVKIIKPHRLDVQELQDQYPTLDILSLDDASFESIAAYNSLLTSVGFYQLFSSFEYILIYQLDAYVFRNELAEWCAKGYDYIGAPSLHQPAFNALAGAQAHIMAKGLSGRRVVFNGGLSLRRIPAIIRYLQIYNRFYPAWKGNEDMLFSQESTRLLPMKLFLKLPEWREALHFAFEKSPAATFELTGHKLPFACHAWERYDPQFWSAYIS
ncbi:DUF5672 family protein [Dyadobacter sandarakinus]|uniref:DUF5672 domain-containing protein n=1 Tax=Dyadobacter sandarakinus TaxID=2747268 RepID=A0ABX7I9N4_9BACT|nr:DUF5672 family protein [Dyadobacter sandarakinus]QRR02821.1 hypothetical protein HWI92_18825 [Dyadobacter sandarakinus]